MARAATRDQDVADAVARGLAVWRERAGLSQSAVARAVGVDHSTVSRWESGSRTPSVPQLIAIARESGMSIDALVGLSGG